MISIWNIFRQAGNSHGAFSDSVQMYKEGRERIMKKLIMLVAVAALMVTLAGCGSLRTPTSGKNSKNVYYNTFFGLSIECAVYGDGIIVNNK